MREGVVCVCGALADKLPSTFSLSRVFNRNVLVKPSRAVRSPPEAGRSGEGWWERGQGQECCWVTPVAGHVRVPHRLFAFQRGAASVLLSIRPLPTVGPHAPLLILKSTTPASQGFDWLPNLNKLSKISFSGF